MTRVQSVRHNKVARHGAARRAVPFRYEKASKYRVSWAQGSAPALAPVRARARAFFIIGNALGARISVHKTNEQSIDFAVGFFVLAAS